jgi:ankyrin repeat protein
MMFAAINNRKAILKLLDSFGADVNLKDTHHGLTALHYAYFYGYSQLGEYMVAKLGADDQTFDDNGRTCYDMAGGGLKQTGGAMKSP